MTLAPSPSLRLVSGGAALDTSPEHFGPLVDSSELLGDREALNARIARDGYLYLPGLLNRADVLEARREITRRLNDAGQIKPGSLLGL